MFLRPKKSAMFLLLASLTLLAGLAPAEAAEQVLVVDGQPQVARLGSGPLEGVSFPVPVETSFGVVGDQMVFAAEPVAEGLDGTDAVVGGFNLWVGDLATGAASRLVDGQVVLRAVVSDDGRIFFLTNGNEIYSMRLDGSDQQLVVEHGATPALSPDGRRLAYAAVPEDWNWDYLATFELRVRDLETGAEKVLARGDDSSDPVWTPDGQALVFRSSRTSLASLWQVSAEGGDAVQLTNRGLSSAADERFVANPSQNTTFRWSPDGRSLLYASRYSDAGEVMVLEFDAAGKAVRALDLGEGRSPVWAGSETVRVARSGEPGVLVSELAVSAEGARKVIDLTAEPRIARQAESQAEVPAQTETQTETGPVAGGEGLAEKAAARFRFPLSYHPGYSAYYDDNSGGGLLEWRCGTATYNGHRGTDILAPCGTSVYAGAQGSVTGYNDGCGWGGWGNTCGGGFGNYYQLSHGSGWYSYYAHMQPGTLQGTAYKGCGAYLGLSWSSGNSTGCHLHFEVVRYGYPFDDPFAGSCSGPESFWCNQNGDGFGYPSRVCCF